MSDNAFVGRDASSNNKNNGDDQETNKFWLQPKIGQCVDGVCKDGLYKDRDSAQKLVPEGRMILSSYQQNISESYGYHSMASIQRSSPGSNGSRSPPPYPFDVSSGTQPTITDIYNNFSASDQQFCQSQNVSDICKSRCSVSILFLVIIKLTCMFGVSFSSISKLAVTVQSGVTTVNKITLLWSNRCPEITLNRLSPIPLMCKLKRKVCVHRFLLF